jgi:precorrin-2 dehydrogenase/sirohydrochlorin ferrochelatase
LNYYPVFLDLKGKKAVVVGGGKVAERKVLVLLKAGADITVISPSITRRLLRERTRKTIRHISRDFARHDLKGAFLAIAATDSSEINREVALRAPALVNVVDVPSECNFIAPSVITRGDLTIAISTGGASPALAKTVRKELEKIYGAEIAGFLEFVRTMRTRTLSEIGHKGKREKFLKSLATPTLLETLRSKGLSEVRKTVLSRFHALTGKPGPNRRKGGKG